MMPKLSVEPPSMKMVRCSSLRALGAASEATAAATRARATAAVGERGGETGEGKGQGHLGRVVGHRKGVAVRELRVHRGRRSRGF